MNSQTERAISKRVDEIYNFYNQGIGDRIKKERLERKLTQADLSKGICSHTYISKLENNRVPVQNEPVMLILERLGLSNDDVLMPEEVIKYLIKSAEYFFYKDIENYEELINKLGNKQFNVIVNIIRFGYYVLIEDFLTARFYFLELKHYLNTLETLGMSTYAIYSCFYNIGIKDYKAAKVLFEMFDSKLQNDEILFSLYCFLQYIIYGHLHLFTTASQKIELANSIFTKYTNYKRNTELVMYMNIFHIYEGRKNAIIFRKEQLNYLSKEQKNNYLFNLYLSDIDSDKYLKLIDKDSKHYLNALYFKSIHCLEIGKQDLYKNTKLEIQDIQYNYDNSPDFLTCMKYHENKDLIMIKEYYINNFLPFAIKTQNICFLRKIKKEVTKIYEIKNRYKNSTVFNEKIEKEIQRIQS